MANYTITSANKKDIDAIKAINEACLAENYKRDIYEQLIKSIIICKDGDKIIGYVIMANLATESKDDDLVPFSWKYNRNLVHTVVFSFAVMPEYRKKGIGTKLLRMVTDTHKKHPILLHARKSNESAKALYNKFGFKILKESLGYYHNPEEDGLIMVYLKGARHFQTLFFLK